MEKPILFNSEMVQAILNGNKTVTRRIVKPAKGYQSKWATTETLTKCPTCYLANVNNELGAQFQHPHAGTTYNSVKVASNSPYGWFKSPYGKTGDLLYVRETWAYKGNSQQIAYKADADKEVLPFMGKWKPSIHMKKEHARIWLKITSIRVERLQDIRESGAKDEGVKLHSRGKKYFNYTKNYEKGTQFVYDCIAAKQSFETLWKAISGRDSWNKNPWVWVIEFEKAELQTCESCSKQTPIETMLCDADANWFCPKCWKELAPVMKAEYEGKTQPL